MVRAWGGQWSLGTSNTSRPLLLQPSSLQAAGATRTQQGPEPRLIKGMEWGSEKVAGCAGPWTLQRTVTSRPQTNNHWVGSCHWAQTRVKHTEFLAPFWGTSTTEALNHQTPVRGEGRGWEGGSKELMEEVEEVGRGGSLDLQVACGTCCIAEVDTTSVGILHLIIFG